MNFQVLNEELAVCRLPADSAVPDGVLDAPFCAVTRTTDELSLVLSVDQVQPDWDVERLSLIHISEPTRLLSISYAVFCLKKKRSNIFL